TATIPRFIGGASQQTASLSTAPAPPGTNIFGGAKTRATRARDAVPIGGTVTPTQTYANNGLVDAPNVVVGGSMPPSWTIVDCETQAGGTCSFQGNNVVVNNPLLGRGQTGSFR